MNIKRTVLIFLAIVVSIVYLTYITNDNHQRILISETGCCSINIKQVHNDKDMMMYQVVYTQNEIQPCVCHSDFESDTTMTTPDTLGDVINGYQEFCYTHHN